MRGAGCRLVAGIPRAPPWCRQARRRTEPGDPDPGLPGRPTRCATNPGRAGTATRGRADAGALGLGFGSYTVEPRRLTCVGRRPGRVRSRGRRLPAPLVRAQRSGSRRGHLPSHAPPAVPRPSGGRAWSRREGLPLLPGAGMRHRP
ncbi:unnamed protein product [Rangifer tarandus platyrhynchus]|uniref:Uncharacterized protein n=2 Tax=Rangifer tarandus platyrhynchus TaxID=3082113 RepID=A0ABN8YFP7_RANTA|nr:unnamed protein product [Rangifer tarandus platyrhynchus]CAI9698707.1 unnamed protein product [Rangifer tarandus platyrhynchus]